MADDAMRDSVVSRVALIIRRCYCMHTTWVRQLDSYNPPDRKYGKYWTNAAIMCITNRINPAEYIEVLFLATKPRWPEISQIASGWALELYKKYVKSYACQKVTDFNIQLQGFSLLVEHGHDPEESLLDENNQFDALFIYAAADANGLPEVAKQYEEAALALYLTSVHYDQIYKDMIPAKFKQLAAELREGVNANSVDRRPSAAFDQRSSDDREVDGAPGAS